MPDLRAWLLQRALPLWLKHGLDQAGGGFVEALSHESYTCQAPFRRLRVLARQIIAFSHADRHGVPGAAQAVAMGIDTLASRAALPEGGYAWRFDLTYAPSDTTRDLYDHAFVLLALAEASAVLPAAALHGRARALLAFLDDHMAHHAGGYAEAIPPILPRRQNPHMHLLEALLAAHGAFGDPIFLERARDLVALFTGRLVDPATGALPEYYDDALRPLTTGGLFEAEPGHHCEWAWLLGQFAGHAGADARLDAVSAGLLAFADEYGSHPVTGDLMDSLASDGAPLARSARLWPQAERLKTAMGARQNAALASLAAYLRPDGLWHERRDAEGGFIPGPSPASTLYHLTTAILCNGAVLIPDGGSRGLGQTQSAHAPVRPSSSPPAFFPGAPD